MKTFVRILLGLLAGLLASGCRPAARALAEERAALSDRVDRIERDVQVIEARTHTLAEATRRTYDEADRIVAGVDTNRYRSTPDGRYYKAVDDGGPAVWVSGVVPVDEHVRRIVWATEGIDADLRTLLRETPAVAQAYYNDRHSLNRIFPPFDVLSQYEPRMNIPEFNFYYLADATHNPERTVVWVDEPYVDPAGRGWMVSCIAPVYVANDLAGVVGVDVTVNGIVENYLLPPDWAWLLVDRGGTVVAATESAIDLFDMPPLSDHRYINTVKSDRFRSEDYNILQSPNANVRTLADRVLNQKIYASTLSRGSTLYQVVAETIPALRWTLFLVVP